MEKESNTKNKFGRILKSFAFILFVAVIVASLMLVNPTPINVWVSILNISVLALALLLVWSLSKEFLVVTVFSIILNSILLILMLMYFHGNQHPTVAYEKAGLSTHQLKQK